MKKIKISYENPIGGRFSIGKYLHILWELVCLRMQQIMVFRLDFFAPFFVDGSLFAIQLLVFDAIYGNVDRVGTWDRGAMLVYIGTFSLLNSVSMFLCFFGIVGIPEKIRSGELDLYLTKPVSPLFRLTFEQINPGSLPLVCMSLCIIGYGIRIGGIQPEGRHVAAYLLWVLLMAVLYYDMEVLMRSLTFYVTSTSRLDQLEEASLEICMKLPGTTLYGAYKVLFYCVLPYGLMATVPVQSLIGELTWPAALWALGIVTVFSLLTAVTWRMGIRRYESASS
ncbi:MAG: ABC transporter permease [Acetatifactor sp.]|nr:ABC transporter permease [Acetatifactor sp.]